MISFVFGSFIFFIQMIFVFGSSFTGGDRKNHMGMLLDHQQQSGCQPHHRVHNTKGLKKRIAHIGEKYQTLEKDSFERVDRDVTGRSKRRYQYDLGSFLSRSFVRHFRVFPSFNVQHSTGWMRVPGALTVNHQLIKHSVGRAPSVPTGSQQTNIITAQRRA